MQEPRVVVRRPDKAAANAYYVPAETQRPHGSALALTASERRKRGDLSREATALLKASEPPKKRRRRRKKADVDRTTPEPSRYVGKGMQRGKPESKTVAGIADQPSNGKVVPRRKRQPHIDRKTAKFPRSTESGAWS